MANRVIIEPLQITNVRTGEVSHSVKICVDADCDWIPFDCVAPNMSCWQIANRENPLVDDVKLLKALKFMDGDIITRMEEVIEEDQEVTIGSKKYTWEQIKDAYANDLVYDEQTDDFTAVIA